MLDMKNLLSEDIKNQISKDASKKVLIDLKGRSNELTKFFSDETVLRFKDYSKLGALAKSKVNSVKLAKQNLFKTVKIITQYNDIEKSQSLLSIAMTRYQAALMKSYVFVQETGSYILQKKNIYSFLFEGNKNGRVSEAKIGNFGIQDILPAMELSFSSSGTTKISLTNLNALKQLEKSIITQTETQKTIADLYLNLAYTESGYRRRTLGGKKLTGRGALGFIYEAASEQVIQEGVNNIKKSQLNKLDIARQTKKYITHGSDPFYVMKDISKGFRSLGGKAVRMELKKFNLENNMFANLTGESTIIRALLKIVDICNSAQSSSKIFKSLKEKLFENSNTNIILEKESEKILKNILDIQINLS